jgi:hypothetical protein
MKNIYTLPTNKPSKLYVRNDVTPIFYSNFQGDAVNIYITSDEEIKEWYIYEDRLLRASVNHSKYEILYGKPVILTTEQDLIDDGVQAIDDEFLEWFVKNSSCEFVEVKIDSYIDKDISESKVFVDYKIIIPKKESKSIIEKMKSLQKQWQKDMDKSLQETLEEAMKQNGYSDTPSDELWREGVEFGANWQAERSYSKEEMEEMYHYGYDNYMPIDKAFKQFKKK